MRLIQTEQRERRRIGEVLHEDVMQMLASISMIVGSAKHLDVEKKTNHADQATSLLTQAIEKLRLLAIELRPEGLVGIGVVEGMQWLARQMKQTHDLEVEVQADAAIEPISEDARLFLYDAARKLLENAASHSGSKKARVEIQRCQPRHVCLIVSDQGAGFDPTQLKDLPGESFGLFSIREQADLLGGRIEINSAPGRGTKISVIVPR